MHRFLSLLPALLTLCAVATAESSRKSTSPAYTAASVVNAASNSADALAPNTIATLYGTDLSYDTDHSLSKNPNGSMLPDLLSGVRVYVAQYAASLYYISPRQINFVIPELHTGDMDFYVSRQGVAGPHVRITLRDVGPGLFQRAPGIIASTHADGSIITKDDPARAGETVVLYGTGLGDTVPVEVVGQFNMVAAQIQRLSDLRVTVGGATLNSASIQYAGVSPGSPGLYQVNVKLPKQLAPNPEILLTIGDQSSPANMILPVR
jgi:uncharacterized protein (TIGR03437 family)